MRTLKGHYTKFSEGSFKLQQSWFEETDNAKAQQNFSTCVYTRENFNCVYGREIAGSYL